MLSLESIIAALGEITETVIIDGVAGFVPLLTVARLLMARGDMLDTWVAVNQHGASYST